MIRTQIQLTEEQSRRLHDAARQSGTSIAELIRQSIDGYLERVTVLRGGPASRLSALAVSGGFRSGLHDVAARHDDYLEDAYRS